MKNKDLKEKDLPSCKTISSAFSITPVKLIPLAQPPPRLYTSVSQPILVPNKFYQQVCKTILSRTRLRRRTPDSDKEPSRQVKPASRAITHNNYFGKPSITPVLLPTPGALKVRVHAASYIVMKASSGEVLAGRRESQVMEVASLTKIMTIHAILHLADKYCIRLDESYKTVSLSASRIAGTSASLTEGDTYSVQELLYGLMLPSGNDAAIALAEWGGQQISKLDGICKLGRIGRIKVFIKLMNNLAN